MSKYLAIIKDSLREALASRVLWVVLVMITLLLLLLVPASYREDLTWQMRDNDVQEWPDLMVIVRDEADVTKPSPAQRIWSLLPEKHQTALTNVKIPGVDQDAQNPFEFLRVFGKFKEEINKLLERRDFYDDVSFNDIPMLSNELRELRNEGIGELSDQEVARFNRLLMEASFPEKIRPSSSTSIQFLYGWAKVLEPFPLRGSNVRETVQSAAAWVMKWFVGAIGIMIAILVTAPIIPQMFDPGSLHLLLSKPISRWLLFLSKFVGGCAFIMIGATYLIGGLWLILGTRFGVWDVNILLSIPIYQFVFAIYYSVSSLIGIVWRSPIVCVALTVVFWLACFAVGFLKIGFENLVWDKTRLVNVIEAGDSLLVANEMGIVQEWDDDSGEWKPVFVSQDQKDSRPFTMLMTSIPREMRPVGPLYDQEEDRLLCATPKFPPTKTNFYVGDRNSDWEANTAITAPTGTLAMFQEESGDVLIVANMGLHRLVGDPTKKQEPVKFFGVTVPFGKSSPFLKVSPEEPVLLTQPAMATMNLSNHELALYTRASITIVRKGGEGQYVIERTHELDGKERQPAVIGIGGNTLIVGRDDGRLQILDATSFEIRKEFQPEGLNQPRFINASPNGRWFTIVFHNGNVWLYDTESGDFKKPRITGQGNISCATFSHDNQLFVCHHTIRLSRYEMPSLKLARHYSPKLGWLARGYQYGLVPLYNVFPKPGELDKTFEYMLSGKETQSSNRSDMTASQQSLDPWTPLWSSALFMLVVLISSCVYIEWQEF
jgi:ABC-type transport system involved in multi-copper enzyme maturation permease subunit